MNLKHLTCRRKDERGVPNWGYFGLSAAEAINTLEGALAWFLSYTIIGCLRIRPYDVPHRSQRRVQKTVNTVNIVLDSTQ